MDEVDEDEDKDELDDDEDDDEEEEEEEELLDDDDDWPLLIEDNQKDSFLPSIVTRVTSTLPQ